MLTIGTCRVCEDGALGLRRCGVCRRVVVLCDECDAAWSDAGASRPPVYADKRGMPCPGCGANLWSAGARWASREEARSVPGIDGPGIVMRPSEPFEPGR